MGIERAVSEWQDICGNVPKCAQRSAAEGPLRRGFVGGPSASTVRNEAAGCIIAALLAGLARKPQWVRKIGHWISPNTRCCAGVVVWAGAFRIMPDTWIWIFRRLADRTRTCGELCKPARTLVLLTSYPACAVLSGGARRRVAALGWQFYACGSEARWVGIAMWIVPCVYVRVLPVAAVIPRIGAHRRQAIREEPGAGQDIGPGLRNWIAREKTPQRWLIHGPVPCASGQSRRRGAGRLEACPMLDPSGSIGSIALIRDCIASMLDEMSTCVANQAPPLAAQKRFHKTVVGTPSVPLKCAVGARNQVRRFITSHPAACLSSAAVRNAETAATALLGGFAVLEIVFCLRHDGRLTIPSSPSMPRRLRVEFEGVIHHVVAWGNATP